MGTIPYHHLTSTDHIQNLLLEPEKQPNLLELLGALLRK